jgi:hypothetical protein
MKTYSIVINKRLVSVTHSDEQSYLLRDQQNKLIGVCSTSIYVNLKKYADQVLKENNSPITIHHKDGSQEVVTGCSKFSSTERVLARI